MTRQTRRSLIDGVRAGLSAGLILVVARTFVAGALAAPAAPVLAIELVACTVLGVAYGSLVGHASRRVETSPWLQAGAGALTALVAWSVALRLLAPGVLEAAVHVVAFGVPLGILYSRAARRSRRARLVLLPPIRQAA